MISNDKQRGGNPQGSRAGTSWFEVLDFLGKQPRNDINQLLVVKAATKTNNKGNFSARFRDLGPGKFTQEEGS